MDSTSSPEALAALAICESILLSLTDNNVIEAAEMKSILGDAAAAHREAARKAAVPGGHAEAAALIERMVAGGNAVRRGARGTDWRDGGALPADGGAESADGAGDAP